MIVMVILTTFRSFSKNLSTLTVGVVVLLLSSEDVDVSYWYYLKSVLGKDLHIS